jgi:hypothetical protein
MLREKNNLTAEKTSNQAKFGRIRKVFGNLEMTFYLKFNNLSIFY